MKTRNTLLACCVVAALTAVAGAIELTPSPGWGDANDWDDAVKYAQKKGLPLAIVLTNKESTCPKCIGATRNYMSDKVTKGMASVMLTDADNVSDLGTIRSQVVDGQGALPKLYIVDPDMNLIGFSKYGDTRTEFHAAATQARQVMAWKKTVARRVKDAQNAAKRGGFAKAIELIEKSVEEDRKLTYRLSTSKEQLEADSKESDKDKEITLPEQGRFFPDLMADARAQFETMAQARLDEGRAAVEKEDYIAARRALTTMARDESDFTQVAQAKELLEQVEALQQAQREARKQAIEARRQAAD